MVILKHYDNGAMLTLEHERLAVVFPDGTVIRLTEEEEAEITDVVMARFLAAHEGTKQ